MLAFREQDYDHAHGQCSSLIMGMFIDGIPILILAVPLSCPDEGADVNLVHLGAIVALTLVLCNNPPLPCLFL